ncbi:hypothetical protein KJ918_02875 [Patescibacteria group bacterium]|nr:hypothetical protein [Patescibacteria group bacterium]
MKGISDVFHVDFQNLQCFFFKDQAYFYFGRDDTERWKEEGRKYLEKTYLTKLLIETKQLRTAFRTVINEIESINLQGASNKTLLDLFLKYFEIVVDIAGIYHASQPEALFFVDQELRKLLSGKYTKEEMEKHFVTLSSPYELDLVQREKVEWFKLLKEEPITDEKYLQHAKNFAAYFFNTYSFKEAIEYLRDKKNHTNESDLEAEIKEIRQYRKKTKNEREKLLKELPTKVTYLSRVLRKVSVDRFALKEGWQGAEFLALNLFSEIAKRIKIDIKDFFYSYGRKDIEKFLLSGKVLNEKEVKRRKEALFIKINNKNAMRLVGDKALIRIKRFLRSNMASGDSVKGMGAQQGVTTGRARILLVEDISSFATAAKCFKKGEVLVTTMTSPNIVSLMKNASGIVTNEGGICSHAAIVSRELGKPCVVGTGNATQVFKTGDYLLIDAGKGEVKKITKEEYETIKNLT